jgi:hypothetical protein
MKKGDIVSVVTVSGEYVGEYKDISPTSITLTNPKMIVSTPEGGMGFARGIAVTGDLNPTEVTFASYVFVIPTNPQVAEAHNQAVNGAPVIATPPEKKIII